MSGRKTAFAGILVFTLSGCASWLNSHVEPSSKPPSNDSVKFAGPLPDSIRYANDWRETYYDAVGEQDLLRSGTALSIIPITAAALYLGITSTGRASRDAVAALGIGGASLFTTANFLGAPTKSQIYLAGSRAMGCAILAARPLLVTQTTFKDFKDDLAGVRSHRTVVSTQLSALKSLTKIYENEIAGKPISVAAKLQIDHATELLEKAGMARSVGLAYQASINQSHVTLNQVVKNIRDQVSAELDRNQPTLQSLASIVSGIGSLAPQFGAVPQVEALKDTFGFLKKSTSGDGTAQSLNGGDDKKISEAEARRLRAVADVRNAIATLDQSSEMLANSVNGLSEVVESAGATKDAVSSIEACDVDDVPGTFRVSPPVVQVELSASQKSHTFKVSGGTGVASATAIGAAATQLDIEQTISGNGYQIIVSLKEDVTIAAGEATVEFSDSTNVNRHSVKVVISAPAVSKDGDLTKVVTALKGSNVLTSGVTLTVTSAKAVEAEKAVEITVTAKGKATKTTSEEELISVFSNLDAVKDVTFVLKISNFADVKAALTVAAVEPENLFSAVSGEPERKKIQTALCLLDKNPVDNANDVDGDWGKRTERASKWYQTFIKAEKQDGVLTKDQLTMLQAEAGDKIKDRCEKTWTIALDQFGNEINTQAGEVRAGDPEVTYAYTVKKFEVVGTDGPIDGQGLKLEISLKPFPDDKAVRDPAEAEIKKVLLETGKFDDYWISSKLITVSSVSE